MVFKELNKGGNKMAIKHTSRGWKQDRAKRSTEKWERGRGAPRKGNPRYRPSTCMRGSKRVKCYRLRK
jgi:hypothetical protein